MCSHNFILQSMLGLPVDLPVVGVVIYWMTMPKEVELRCSTSYSISYRYVCNELEKSGTLLYS